MKKVNSLYLLAFLVVASLVLSACGPANNNAANNDVANNSADAEDMEEGSSVEFKNPDTYVYVTISGDPETLDPAWTYETFGSGVQGNVYESLIWFDRERNDLFVPILATDWEVNEAGTEWVFNIREGVNFHEGGTLEAHDVAYSMQRALLQDRSGGPHWMTHEAFFLTYSMNGTQNQIIDAAAAALAAEAYAALTEEEKVTFDEAALAESEAAAVAYEAMTDDEKTAFDEAASAADKVIFDAGSVAACEAIKDAVVADDAAGTVTFNLPTSTPWFLALMANTFVGNVTDMEWMVEQGAWDGSCDTWEDYSDPAAEDTVLFNTANGTGPYILDHWTPGDEIVLSANENYWRADDNPIWEGGPSGVASIKNIVIKMVGEWGTRLAMFEAGDADFVAVPAQFNSQVEPNYGMTCPSGGECVDNGGWIQAYTNNATPSMANVMLNWAVNAEGGNPAIGSGKYDGNGVAPDFFADIHIRKAFSYCLDYDTVINEALDGEGSQSQGPIIQGMLGYRDDGFVYSYDLDKCAEEFQASETGVWDTGFYVQASYNTGNDARRLTLEVLKAGIEEVNPGFTIQIVGMPWPVFLASMRADRVPVALSGWGEDFHDPHNWVHPFTHSQGAYGANVNATQPTAGMLDALVDAGAKATDVEERRAIYEELQLVAQEEALMIWAYQPVARFHFSPWIEGWYFNAAYSGKALSYVYAYEKVGP